ncbi:hypothetical protein F4825DRAFT_405536 [Nemania diffusa]|nr:hypothetical protein F4825DRAFT_405536 [Nemania diffusa]
MAMLSNHALIGLLVYVIRPGLRTTCRSYHHDACCVLRAACLRAGHLPLDALFPSALAGCPINLFTSRRWPSPHLARPYSYVAIGRVACECECRDGTECV